jgi:hypothetical protein
MKPGHVLLLALSQAVGADALAQGAIRPAALACPKPAEVTAQHLIGEWRAQFGGQPGAATLLIDRHPRYADSVSGTIERDGQNARLVGDIEDGEVTLEESLNGVTISGTWIGDVAEGSCGREIRGTWQAGEDRQPVTFVLRKQ